MSLSDARDWTCIAAVSHASLSFLSPPFSLYQIIHILRFPFWSLADTITNYSSLPSSNASFGSSGNRAWNREIQSTPRIRYLLFNIRFFVRSSGFYLNHLWISEQPHSTIVLDSLFCLSFLIYLAPKCWWKIRHHIELDFKWLVSQEFSVLDLWGYAGCDLALILSNVRSCN